MYMDNVDIVGGVMVIFAIGAGFGYYITKLVTGL